MTSLPLLAHQSPIRALTEDRLGEFAAWCSTAHGDFALDTETTGLDTRAPGFDVTHIAFGASDGTAWVQNASDKALLADSLRVAVGSGRKWWAHNATYDAAALYAVTDLRLRGLLCTLVLTRTLSPDTIGNGGGSLKTLRPATERALESLRDRFVAAGGSPSSRDWLADAMTRLPVDDPAMLAYVATDAIECARLVGAWRSASTKTHRGIALRECRIEDLWRWAGERGYRVDLDMLTSEISALDASRADGLRAHGIDLTRDTDDTRRWLLVRGVRVTDPDGKPTLSHKRYDNAFVPDAARAEWDAFVALRDRARVGNKLTELKRFAASTGRIHPSIQGIGAHTGRMAIGKPALQNLPETLRGLLLADQGRILVGCDLDRVEPRVVAAVSQDPDLIQAVTKDVYVELAVAVYGEAARGDSAKRKVAKTAFLALLYGQGTKSLSANLGITEDEAREVSVGLLAAYPAMAAWMADVKRRAKAGLPLETIYGRPLPPTSDKPYRAVNWTIQGSAADLFKACTSAAAEALGRDTLWLPVHDELIVQVPDADADGAVRALGGAMTTDLLGVPITGTPVVLGGRWGKA